MHYYEYGFGIIGMASRYVLSLVINWKYRHVYGARIGLRVLLEHAIINGFKHILVARIYKLVAKHFTDIFKFLIDTSNRNNCCCKIQHYDYFVLRYVLPVYYETMKYRNMLSECINKLKVESDEFVKNNTFES